MPRDTENVEGVGVAVEDGEKIRWMKKKIERTINW